MAILTKTARATILTVNTVAACSVAVALELDLGSDLELVDGLRSIQYRRRAESPAWGPTGRQSVPLGTKVIPISHALRREVTFREVSMSGGLLETGDVLFTFPQSELDSAPSPGDQITEDGDPTIYRVVSFRSSTLRGRWKAYGRRGAG